MAENIQNHFENKIILNKYTLHEIGLGLYNYRKGKRKLPVALLLLALCTPLIYAFATGNIDVVILAVPILVIGLIALFVYVGYSAYKAAKSREKVVNQILKEHGSSEVLCISFSDHISYTFDGNHSSLTFDDIEKVIELDMYLIIVLKNGVDLPVWKDGFTEGSWDDFIIYFKQMTGK